MTHLKIRSPAQRRKALTRHSRVSDTRSYTGGSMELLSFPLLYPDPHLKDEETEEQRGEVTCPRLPSWQVAEAKLEPRSPDCQLFVPCCVDGNKACRDQGEEHSSLQYASVVDAAINKSVPSTWAGLVPQAGGVGLSVPPPLVFRMAPLFLACFAPHLRETGFHLPGTSSVGRK